MRQRILGTALRISVTYGVASALWIALSDQVLARVVPSQQLYARLQTYKGWAFVLVTAILLFVVLLGHLRSWSQEYQGRQEAETKYRSLVENLALGVVIVDVDERIILANNASERIFGTVAGGLTGKNLREYLDERETRHVRAETEKRSRGETSLYEVEIMRSDGERRCLQVIAAPHYDTQNHFSGALATFQDVTDTLLLKRELEEERIRFMTLISSLPDAVYMKDLEGRFVVANPAVAEMMHAESPQDLIGKTDYDFYPREQADEYRADERRLLEDGQPIVNKSEPKNLTGALRWVLTTKVRLLGEGGKPRGLVGVSRDVTERVKAEEDRGRLHAQLQQAQKMEAVGRLAGGIAHDFNNILTAIYGYGEWGLSLTTESDQARHCFTEIMHASTRAASLTSQLLTFSRRRVLELRSVDVGELVKGTLDMLRRLLGESIDVHSHISDGLWKVRADPGQLEQVVINLAVNARDAMPTGGTLTIETGNTHLRSDDVEQHAETRAGDYVVLSMTDTGHGMDETTIKHLFEPFFTTKRIGKGTGLGLATVYGIVKQSGGHIDCHSEPGRGTTFTVLLPRSEAEEEPVQAAKEIPGAMPTGHERILFVDDDDAIREIAVSALKSAGYSIVAARNGSEALQMSSAMEIGPDLLVADVVMPGMNGIDLGQRLLARFPGLRVLYVSGYAEDAILHHGFQYEEMDLLQKPFTVVDLLRRVRNSIARQ
ncbi:MAG TPA: PAS domain-containing protein [Spirochaetia bacterium]|nr:PAS domain-containing protein [Spirochaetia bacterium]